MTKDGVCGSEYQVNMIHFQEILPERQLAWLIQRHKYAESALQKKEPWYVPLIDLFRLPIGYKPLIIQTLIFFAQNFAGVYITLFFAATFFQVSSRYSQKKQQW